MPAYEFLSMPVGAPTEEIQLAGVELWMTASCSTELDFMGAPMELLRVGFRNATASAAMIAHDSGGVVLAAGQAGIVASASSFGAVRQASIRVVHDGRVRALDLVLHVGEDRCDLYCQPTPPSEPTT